MKLPTHLPEQLEKALRKVDTFFEKEYPHVRLYLVGGAVRDMVMGRQIYDLDIECFGIEPEDFERAMQKLGAKGVGKSFYVYKFDRIDLALPRIEQKVAQGHRGFSVSLAHDTKEASRRRDFTMNALMLDLESGQIIDHWGGMRDIQARLIRVVDEKKFIEDSLRVLRAMQFSARLKFRIESHSRDLMRRMDLDDLTPERIFWEFEKMFNAPWLHYGLFAMIDLYVGKKILGLSIGKEAFFKMARHMQKVRKIGDETMRPYYFLYILGTDLKHSSRRLCEKIHTPKIYTKVLGFQKRVPHRISDRFLGALSLRYPMRQWLGIYADDVLNRTKMLGIYDKQFDPGIRPVDLLEEGFVGGSLGRELRRRILTALKVHFKVES